MPQLLSTAAGAGGAAAAGDAAAAAAAAITSVDAPALARQLRLYREAPTVWLTACAAVTSSCAGDGQAAVRRRELGALGCVELLLSACRNVASGSQTPSRDARYLTAALEALSSLIASDDRNCAIAVTNGLLETVQTCFASALSLLRLSAAVPSASLSPSSLSLLSSSSSSSSSSPSCMSYAAVASPADEPRALATQCLVVLLHALCCGASSEADAAILATLTSLSTQLTGNDTCVVDATVVDAIAATLRTRPHSSAVVRWCVHALASLCPSPSQFAPAQLSDAVRPLLAVFGAHTTDTAIVAPGLTVLRSVPWHGHFADVVDDAFSTLLAVAAHHHDDAAVVASALAVLCDLATCAADASLLARAVPTACGAIRRHGGDAVVARRGAVLLTLVAQRCDGDDGAVFGCVDDALGVMTRHVDDGDVVEAALALLMTLAVKEKQDRDGDAGDDGLDQDGSDSDRLCPCCV